MIANVPQSTDVILESEELWHRTGWPNAPSEAWKYKSQSACSKSVSEYWIGTMHLLMYNWLMSCMLVLAHAGKSLRNLGSSITNPCGLFRDSREISNKYIVAWGSPALCRNDKRNSLYAISAHSLSVDRKNHVNSSTQTSSFISNIDCRQTRRVFSQQKSAASGIHAWHWSLWTPGPCDTDV